MSEARLRGAGGTEGGIGTFLIGFVMAVAGGWLLTNQVMVTTGGWRIWGYNGFGLSLVPLIVGVAFLMDFIYIVAVYSLASAAAARTMRQRRELWAW